jgi:hypothetical protein
LLIDILSGRLAGLFGPEFRGRAIGFDSQGSPQFGSASCSVIGPLRAKL